MAAHRSWFDVDKEGLAKLMAGRSKEFLIYELVQNAWDEDTKRVDITLAWDGRRRRATISVADDNPTGFANLTHAWTLFAESAKKGNVRLRGRFNMGEKLFLALCESAIIMTTTGCVRFDKDGRHVCRKTTDTGSRVEAVIPMSKEDFEDCERAVDRLIPPPGIETYYNGELVAIRRPVLTFTEQLETEYAGEDGVLKPTWRKVKVRLYEPGPDETAHIYEMGIPVVPLEGGDKWHLDVQQKVPLNMNRDNVRPAYLRALRVHTLNHAHGQLDGKEEATAPWVKEAAGDKRVSEEALTAILDLRFGKKRVAYDLNDPEANNRAVAAGYTIVTGGALSGGEWANVKRGGAVPPAGKVAPSSKVLNKAGGKDDAYPEKRWTDDMRRVMAYTFEAGGAILGKTITVRLANRPSEGAAAWYGDGRLTYNVARLGRRWFKQANDAEDLNRLLIHECAHELEGNHLSDDYHDACCTLGARLARLWRDRPEILETKAGDFAPNMTSVLGLGGL